MKDIDLLNHSLGKLFLDELINRLEGATMYDAPVGDIVACLERKMIVLFAREANNTIFGLELR